MVNFWGRATSAEKGSIGEEGPQAAAPLQRYSPVASLETIGLHNETLRSEIEGIELGFEHFEVVKTSFRGLLSPLSELLADFEATKKRMHETKMKLDLLQDSHEGLSARHGALLKELDRFSEAKNALERENREFQQRVTRTDAALTETQTELRERSAAKERLERLLESETRQVAALSSEIARFKGELASKDQGLADLEVELKATSDECALLAQENEGLRGSLESRTSHLDTANRQIAEHESQNDRANRRIAELEQAYAAEQALHAELRSKHVEHVERSRSEILALGNTVLGVRSRADTADKILAEARGQIREKIEELRGAERRLLESGIQIDGLERSVRSLKDDLAAANERSAGAERLRLGLVDQVSSMTEALRAKDSALQSAASKIEVLTAKADETAKAGERAREDWERRLATLQQAFDRERAERNLAEGALQASRAERQQTRRVPPTVGEAFGRASAAQPQANGSPPPQNNVTQLPRAVAP